MLNNFIYTTTKLISLLFPAKCLKCSKIINTNGGLCINCWGKIDFISNPACKICGIPFEFDIGIEDYACGECIARKPSFDQALSVFKYDANSKSLIHKFKYGDQTYLSNYFAKWIYNNIKNSPILDKCSHITSVPLHKNRIKRRFYNQSALIAKKLASLTNKNFFPNLLIKNRHDTQQSSLTKKQRLKNVKNSFIINPKMKNKITRANILLIDDVYTTGSTLNECSKVLRKNGASIVNTVTLARVLK